MPPRILCISNGHGEDNHASYVVRALRQLEPDVEVAAVPLVGEGNAYHAADVPVVGPTLTLPSGGFAYMHRGMWLQDVRAGLIGLAWRQARAVRRVAPSCAIVHAVGDHVGQAFAWISGRPFVSFISPLSALYEGHLRLNGVLTRVFASPRCLAVFTRDRATAEDLARQGVSKARFGGIPSLDWLVPTGRALGLREGAPVVCLLPGSRLPEAARNLRLLLELAERIARRAAPDQVQFVAPLVAGALAALPAIAADAGWTHGEEGLRRRTGEGLDVRVACRADSYADMLHASTLILGMAGLAVDQAVALGKAVILVPGEGPQHTFRFAEAQSRLLGLSAQLAGRSRPATPEDLDEAARLAVGTLRNASYLAQAADSGRARLGSSGASYRIAETLLDAARGAPAPRPT